MRTISGKKTSPFPLLLSSSPPLLPSYDLYPNPSKGKLYLQWHAKETARFEVYNALSQWVSAFRVQEGRNELQLRLEPGMYFLRQAGRRISFDSILDSIKKAVSWYFQLIN